MLDMDPHIQPQADSAQKPKMRSVDEEDISSRILSTRKQENCAREMMTGLRKLCSRFGNA